MQSEAKIRQAERGEAVTITVKVEPDGNLTPRSAEIIGLQSRVRFSFSADATIEDSFSAEAAEEILELAKRAVDQRGMLSMPDHTMRISGLVLADCSVLAADVADGGQQIMIRFSLFTGDILALFAEDYMPRKKLADAAIDHAITLVERAYLPLVDFLEHVDEQTASGAISREDDMGSALLNIAERIRDLKMCKLLAMEAMSARVRRASLPDDSEEPAFRLQAGE